MKNKGITLISLVITIVIMLILAGVSISFIIGQNGMIGKVQTSKEKSEEKEAKEQIEMIIDEWIMEDVQNNQGLEEFLGMKLNNKEIEKVVKNDNNTFLIKKGEYVATIDNKGNIINLKKAEPEITISNIRIVNNNNGTGNNLEKKSVDQENTLYINFDSSIKGGDITEISPKLPFAVTKNGMYTFTIKGKVKDKEYSKNYEVRVDQFNSMFNVTSSIQDASLSNTASKIEMDTTYTTNINPKQYYYIRNVIVKMDGKDITSTVYNTDNESINIENVFGDIEINVVAEEKIRNMDDYNLKDVVLNSTDFKLVDGDLETPVKQTTAVDRYGSIDCILNLDGYYYITAIELYMGGTSDTFSLNINENFRSDKDSTYSYKVADFSSGGKYYKVIPKVNGYSNQVRIILKIFNNGQTISLNEVKLKGTYAN